MNIETQRKISNVVNPEIINFIDYLCTEKKLNCENDAELLSLIINYNKYIAKKKEEAIKAKQAKELADDAAREKRLSQMNSTDEIRELQKNLEEKFANRTRPDTSPSIYETREPIDKETMKNFLIEARETDKENNINLFRQQKKDIKNNLDFVISSLQFKIVNCKDLKIELQNNIYKLIHSGDVRNNDKIEDFNSDLLNISNFLYLDQTTSEDFDYKNYTLELGNINLLIGNLVNKLTIIINGQTGGKATKYKSTGITVFILYKKKKYNRTIYVKDKGNTKYCKINNEYILLSKLKVIL
jgi:hypothetical protein